MSSAEVDFLKLDLLLADEEKLARDSIRAFVDERIERKLDSLRRTSRDEHTIGRDGNAA